MTEYLEISCVPPSRHEKSLGLLTKKFVHLLECADDGVLDLKIVRPFFCPKVVMRMNYVLQREDVYRVSGASP